jgi:hypothetical protein
MEEIEYFQEQGLKGLERDKWNTVEWREFEVGWRSARSGEGKGIKVGWDVKCIKGSEVQWVVGLGELCVL